MTDFLEALLDLPQEEEEMWLELPLPAWGRRPGTDGERAQTRGPGRAAEGTSLSAASAQRTALTEAEAGVGIGAGAEAGAEAAVQPPVPLRGAARARQAEETAVGAAQRRRADPLRRARSALGGGRGGGYAGPLDRALEAARDALVRGTAFSLAQHPGGREYAAADAARYARVSSGEASAGGAAALERRLARSGVRPPAVLRSDGEQVTVEAGPDLEELDRRVRRDARRYDGALTLY